MDGPLVLVVLGSARIDDLDVVVIEQEDGPGYHASHLGVLISNPLSLPLKLLTEIFLLLCSKSIEKILVPDIIGV